MQGDEVRWQTLCAQAAQEKDPQKLLQLVTEINAILARGESTDPTKAPPLDLIAAERLRST